MLIKEIALLVFWMCTRVNDTIHIQVQIIKLHLIRVWFACINRSLDAIAFFGLQKQLEQLLQYSIMQVEQLIYRVLTYRLTGHHRITKVGRDHETIQSKHQPNTTMPAKPCPSVQDNHFKGSRKRQQLTTQKRITWNFMLTLLTLLCFKSFIKLTLPEGITMT